MPFRERCSWQHPDWVIRKEAVVIEEAESLYDIDGVFVGKYVIQRRKAVALLASKAPISTVHQVALQDFIPRVLLGAPEVPIVKELPRKQLSRGSSVRELVLEVTAYNWTGNRCANGEWPIEGTTVAMNGIPFGTRVFIPGIGERIVQDRIGHGTQLDIYMGQDRQKALNFGRQKLKVIVRN
jgi:3D (Asp-Asp-Asp) domain-containing protein